MQEPCKRCDAAFLSEILNSKKIGCLQNQEIIIDDFTSIGQLKDIFFTRHIARKMSEGSFFFNHSTWTSFRHNIPGRKIPVKVLDAFMARLIKSLSAVGVLTDLSCDRNPFTHDKNERISDSPWIEFSGNFNSIYFNTILDVFVSPRIELKCNWYSDSGNTRFSIKNTTDNLFEVYQEIQEVANILYENRIMLREMKKNIIDKCIHDENMWTPNLRDDFHDNNWNQCEPVVSRSFSKYARQFLQSRI